MSSFSEIHHRVLASLRRSSSHGKTSTLLHRCVAEAFGTGVIVFVGVGSVHSAVFTGAQAGIWQIAVLWGFGVALAIYTTATVSGAHLNPAVTFAFALLRPESFEYSLLLPYWFAQLLGAFVAALWNYVLFRPVLLAFEEKNGIKRGEPESILSAMAFGEYFPNPGFQYDGTSQSTINADDNATDYFLKNSELGWDKHTITTAHSFLLEAFGTAFLMLIILSVTDPRNTTLKNKDFAPYFIGFTVAILESLFIPMNQGGFNPARDFGPRLASYVLGWDTIAIPGPNKGFWTYILGPLFGALVGGAFYDFVLRPADIVEEKIQPEKEMEKADKLEKS